MEFIVQMREGTRPVIWINIPITIGSIPLRSTFDQLRNPQLQTVNDEQTATTSGNAVNIRRGLVCVNYYKT